MSGGERELELRIKYQSQSKLNYPGWKTTTAKRGEK